MKAAAQNPCWRIKLLDLLKQHFLNLSVYRKPPEILLKCRFNLSMSGVGLASTQFIGMLVVDSAVCGEIKPVPLLPEPQWM